MSVTTTSNNLLSRIITGIFTILITAISALFWITLFSPGNQWTRWFFDMIFPLTAILENIYDVVGFPVQWLCQWVASFLPEPLTKYFPVTTVKTLVTGFLNLLGFIPGFTHHPVTQSIYNFSYDTWFPGVIDWQILLTIKFLGFVESILNFFPNALGSPKLQTMINQNREQMLDDWSSNQPYTADTLPAQPALPIASSYNAHSEFLSFDEYQPRPLPIQAAAPLPLPIAAAPLSTEDPNTGLLNKHGFQLLLDTQFNWARSQRRPIGLVWLEIATLSVAPATTLLQLGRWLKNLSPKEGHLIPVRYSEHSIVVLLVNQSEEQAKLVAKHLQQRLSEFRFAPLVGFSHRTIIADGNAAPLIEEAYQKAVHSNTSTIKA